MDRCYRKAFSDEEGLEMLKAQEGTHFDPEMIAVFIKNHQKFIDLKTKVNSTVINFDNLISLDLVKQVF
jgi:putative two-component system response regulator